jgi:hypothetical protein
LALRKRGSKELPLLRLIFDRDTHLVIVDREHLEKLSNGTYVSRTVAYLLR